MLCNANSAANAARWKCFHLLEKRYNSTYILFAKLSCQGDRDGTFGLRVKLPPAHLFTTHSGVFTLSVTMLNVIRKAADYDFCSLWFDQTGNRIRLYRFSSRRFIHSATDRFDINPYRSLSSALNCAKSASAMT